MIVAIGGYYDRNTDIPAHVQTLIQNADQIAVNGFFPMIIAMNTLGLKSLLLLLFHAFDKESNMLGIDRGYIQEIVTCYRLMKPGALIVNLRKHIRRLLRSEEIPESILETRLHRRIFVELFACDTGDVYLQSIDTLEQAIFFSFLHPGLVISEDGIFNTMYLTACPCLSLLDEQERQIHVFYRPYSIPRFRTIAKYLKALQMMRSEALTSSAINVLSKKNNVYLTH